MHDLYVKFLLNQAPICITDVTVLVQDVFDENNPAFLVCHDLDQYVTDLCADILPRQAHRRTLKEY